MIKVEGWNGILLSNILEEIKKEMGYASNKEALARFIDACSYNVVLDDIITQIKYVDKQKRSST